MTGRILKQYGKRDLERVTALATRKQWTAEQALARYRWRYWGSVGAAASGGFVVGWMASYAVAVWLVLR